MWICEEEGRENKNQTSEENPLIYTLPVGKTTCLMTTLGSWTKQTTHSGNPISVQAQIGAKSTCDPIYANETSIAGAAEAGTRGCSLGPYPVYVVNATDATVFQAAVNFGRYRDIRLIIKNTGHRDDSYKLTANSVFENH